MHRFHGVKFKISCILAVYCLLSLAILSYGLESMHMAYASVMQGPGRRMAAIFRHGLKNARPEGQTRRASGFQAGPPGIARP